MRYLGLNQGDPQRVNERDRIKKYEFEEGVDFVSFNNSIKAEKTYVNT